jgi:hypothetical protein
VIFGRNQRIQAAHASSPGSSSASVTQTDVGQGALALQLAHQREVSLQAQLSASQQALQTVCAQHGASMATTEFARQLQTAADNRAESGTVAATVAAQVSMRALQVADAERARREAVEAALAASQEQQRMAAHQYGVLLAHAECEHRAELARAQPAACSGDAGVGCVTARPHNEGGAALSPCPHSADGCVPDDGTVGAAAPSIEPAWEHSTHRTPEQLRIVDAPAGEVEPPTVDAQVVLSPLQPDRSPRSPQASLMNVCSDSENEPELPSSSSLSSPVTSGAVLLGHTSSCALASYPDAGAIVRVLALADALGEGQATVMCERLLGERFAEVVRSDEWLRVLATHGKHGGEMLARRAHDRRVADHH